MSSDGQQAVQGTLRLARFLLDDVQPLKTWHGALFLNVYRGNSVGAFSEQRSENLK